MTSKRAASAVTFVLGVLAGGGLANMSGCAVAPDGYSTFLNASRTAAFETIGPVYQQYVENDATIDVDVRESRLFNLQQWQDAVDAQLPAVGE